MRYLRTNTAARVTVGPFLDKTDGITPKTALTVTAELLTFICDVANVPTLILNVAPTASAGNNDMVHVTGDVAGFYDLELAAADLNYVGRAMLCLNNVAQHVPVFAEFMILPAAVYDAMVLGTAAFPITSNVKQNQALTGFEFMMTDSTTHAPVTGKTVTCTRSIDGGAFAAGTLANVGEISNGMYKVDFGAGDLNGKVIVLRCTAATSDDTFERFITQP